MWKLIQKLFGSKSSDTGPAPSSPSLPSALEENSKPEAPKESKPAPKQKTPKALENLAKIALSQVGVKESGGNNNGAKIRKYQSATSLKPASWPWCAAFTGWVIQEWLKDKENAEWLGLKVMTPDKWRPKTAAAFGYIEWAKARPSTTKIIPKSAVPKVGDIAVFDFSHIGIVSKVNKTNFQCVEGNTSAAGGRDSETGDGVWLKTRTFSTVRCYIRINPSTAR